MIVPAQQAKSVKMFSSNPLNVAASRLLPEDWTDQSVLPVVSLMLWGIREAGIEVQASPSQPNSETLENLVERMSEANPQQAMDLLTRVDGEVTLSPDALNQVKSPEEGARRLLEALHQNLVATAE